MGAVEPGEGFTIEYGKGRQLCAVGLSFRQERALAKLEDSARAAESAEQVFDLFEQGLRLCLPHMGSEEVDELLDVLNLEMLQDVLRKINRGQHLTEDERKK